MRSGLSPCDIALNVPHAMLTIGPPSWSQFCGPFPGFKAQCNRKLKDGQRVIYIMSDTAVRDIEKFWSDPPDQVLEPFQMLTRRNKNIKFAIEALYDFPESYQGV